MSARTHKVGWMATEAKREKRAVRAKRRRSRGSRSGIAPTTRSDKREARRAVGWPNSRQWVRMRKAMRQTAEVVGPYLDVADEAGEFPSEKLQ